MWARVKLEIGWADLAFALAAAARGGDRDRRQLELERLWAPAGDGLACISVRGAFDLLLQALLAEGRLAPGDEVLFSALNVKQMVRAVERLGLVPVPVDLDLADMSPRLEGARAALTPRSRLFVAAHLFGARLDMAPIAAFAEEHGLVLVEDCAQAYAGPAERGCPAADVALFSFGPIKTRTCLGGALARVADPGLLARMRALQAGYPAQPERDMASRALRFAVLKLATSRLGLGAIDRACRLAGRDYDAALADSVRDVAKQTTPRQLRRRCSAALLALMRRRLRQDPGRLLAERTARGRLLRRLVAGADAALPAGAAARHDYWVFPAIVGNPAETVAALRAAGFDAATLPRSQAVAPPPGRPDLAARVAEAALRGLIVLPCRPDMPEAALARQAAVFARVARAPALPATPAAGGRAAE